MYGKIFSQIYDSSIAEDYQLRTVFQDMIILCDLNGVIDMTHEALARRTNVPLEIVKEAIRKLELPDPKSRTHENDGARIKRLDEHRDWGWIIINHKVFRDITNEEQRRFKTLQRVHKFRGKAAPVTQCNAHVTVGNAGNAMQKQITEADADADSRSKEVPPNPHSGAGVDDETFNRTRLQIPQPPPIVTYTADCRPILAYLNQRAGMSFAEVSDNLDLIQDRLNQGITAEDIRQMIDHQCAEWKGTSHEKFLRPITLFGEKFHQYFGQKGKPVVRSVNGQTRKFDGTNKLQREIDRVMKK